MGTLNPLDRKQGAYSMQRRGVLRVAAGVVGGGHLGTARATNRPSPTPIPLLTSDEVDWQTIPERAYGVRPGSLLRTEVDKKGTLYSTGNFIWAAVPSEKTKTTSNETGRESGQDGGDQNADEARRLFLGTAGHAVLPHPDTVDTAICTHCSASSATFEPLGDVVFASYCKRLGTDFGLVEIPERLHDLVDSAVPTFGGPTAVENMSVHDRICHYGHGVGVGRSHLTRGRIGVAVAGSSGGWRGRTAAGPGDSGSPVLLTRTDTDGFSGTGAAGILTKLLVAESATAGGITVQRATDLVNGKLDISSCTTGGGVVHAPADDLTVSPVLPGQLNPQ